MSLDILSFSAFVWFYEAPHWYTSAYRHRHLCCWCKAFHAILHNVVLSTTKKAQ